MKDLLGLAFVLLLALLVGAFCLTGAVIVP
jgi:hypothetical protein